MNLYECYVTHFCAVDVGVVDHVVVVVRKLSTTPFASLKIFKP